jgi:hypothetical protein
MLLNVMDYHIGQDIIVIAHRNQEFTALIELFADFTRVMAELARIHIVIVLMMMEDVQKAVRDVMICRRSGIAKPAYVIAGDFFRDLV